MKEFGSDFHSIGLSYDTGRVDFTRIIGNAYYLADGRQGLSLIIIQEGWKRLWVPEYFCYEIIESIAKRTNVELMFYLDFPGNDNHEIYKHLPYKEGDALLRMNFFGLSDNSGMVTLPIPVVEDHSHDLLGRWALFSEADWCFASLRKSLPLAEGGVVWSPKRKTLDLKINSTMKNEMLAAHRWKAMEMKSEYLVTEQPSPALKGTFRKLYLATENELDTLDYSVIDQQSMAVLREMDINAWYNQKKRNWKRLTSALSDGIDYLIPTSDSCTPFSLVLRTANKEQREGVRCGLIKNSVYPAVLWNLPKSVSIEAMNVSHRLLSVHCDGRYSEDDMEKLAFIINNVYQGL